MQPDKLAKSFEGPADGMYARLLFAWPPEPAYQPLSDDALEVDPDILNALARLDGLAEFEDDNLVVRPIELSAEARERFEQFLQFLHREKQAFDGREREWLAKAPAHILRLAGTLCLHSSRSRICGSCFDRAWHAHHAGRSPPAGGNADRRDRDVAQRRAAVHGQADRAGDHLRQPGGDRDRERAVI